MRRYDISIGNGQHYYSLVNGVTDPGALNVEMDIQVISVDTPSGGSYVRIWGMGLAAISQTQSLFGKQISVSGGMAAGLPLANPQQYGLLASGLVQQAFGNWIGVDQTLDIIFVAGSTPPTGGGPNPKPPEVNLSMNWLKGQPIQEALMHTLQQGYPGVSISMNIAANITADQDQKQPFTNLEQLGFWVRRYSQQLLGGQQSQAQGVSIVNPTYNSIAVFDGGSSGGGTVSYTDLIGQPTWIKPQTIQFKTVMRSDIHVGNTITLPSTFNNVQAGAGYATPPTPIAFSGTFQVIKVRHVGNFRQSTADAWVTIFDASTSGAV